MFWLALLAPSHAIDLATVAPGWEQIETGPGGSDDDDRATGVALDSAGNAVVSGWLDGDPGHGHDAIVLAISPTGTELWREVRDSGAAGDATATSEERWHAVAVDTATDEILLCGQAGSPNRDTIWLTELRAPNLASSIWSFPFDGGLESPDQACHSVAFTATGVVSLGWVADNPTVAGKWQAIFQGRAQPIVSFLWEYDVFDDIDVPDQGHQIAIDVGGNPVAVGVVSPGGSPGSLQNDTDAAIVKFTTNGSTIWDDVVRGADSPSLDDRYTGVAVSPTTNNVAAVGWLNVGPDNGDNQDLDGIIRLYDPIGYLGEPVFEWSPATVIWDGPGDQGITAVVFEDGGELYVAGFTPDPVAGERWSIVRLDPITGVELSRWDGPAHDRARPTSMALEGDTLVIAGWVDDGTGPDLAVLSLSVDSDGDGTADVQDGCPDDDDKIDPGVCGCDIPDLDSDNDGLLNCEDGCPSDASKTEPLVCGCGMDEDDADSDGTPDCVDDCDSDPGKIDGGVCGCGVPDADVDGDGYLTCQDQCPDSAPGAVVDTVGCEVEGDTGDTGVQASPVDDKSGCGCSASGAVASWVPLLAPLAFLLRRRLAA